MFVVALAVTLVLMLPATSRGQMQAGAPWPCYRGDLQQTGQSPYSGPRTPTVRWTSPVGTLANVYSAPLIAADGTLYYGSSATGALYAVHGANGTARWTVSGVNPQGPAVLSANGTLYVGQSNALSLFNAATGVLLGKMPASAVQGLLIGPDAVLYMACSIGSTLTRGVHAYNTTTMVRIWTCCTGAEATSAPTLASDGSLYVGVLNDY